MATDHTIALEALATALRAISYPCRIRGEVIDLPALQSQAAVALANVGVAGESTYAQLIIEASSLRMSCVGFGHDRRAAIQTAVDQWVAGALPAFHASRADAGRNSLGAETRQMLVRDDDSGDLFGWDIHVGPVRITQLGDGQVPAPKQADTLELLFDELRPICAHARSSVVEIVASRLPDQVSASCTYGGEVWPRAEAVIEAWISSFEDAYDYFTLRQYIVMQSVSVDRVDPRLVHALDAVSPGSGKAN